MRSQSAGEITVLAGADYGVHGRVKIANGDGTLVDYSSYFERITIDEDIDQPTAQATVEFRRDASSTLSLAPLREDSTLNRLDDGTTYSPALDAGRLITIEVATVAIGASPAAGDWKEVFRGYLDSVDAASSTVSIVCRDQGGVLVDRWIEEERPYGYDTGIEVVMQAILDDTLGAGVVTLTTTGTPSFNIRTYNQQSEPIMDALRTLAHQIGWDIRYKWNGSAYALTLYEPARSNTTPDRSFTADLYYGVTRLSLDRVDVRNAITINYRDSADSYKRKNLSTTDATSIARYGRRFFGITESDESAVDTAAEASLLIGNILLDLKDPKAEMEIEAQFFWPAELGDLYRFPDNDVHFSTNQDWAVTTIRHELWGGTGRTYLQVRGTPSGGFLTWIAKPRVPPTRPLFDRVLNFREVSRTATVATVGWELESDADEQWLWLITPAQPLSADPVDSFVGAPTLRLTAATTSHAVTVPAQGLITYGRLMPVFANGIVGRAWDFTVQPGTAERLIQQAEITATAADDVNVRVYVADPTPASDITIEYAVVGCTATPASGTIAAASVTADIATTGYVDFTVTRGTGTSGRITFTATSTDRLSDSDSVDIPATRLIGGGTAPTVATGLAANQIGTGATITVAGTDLAGTVTLTTGTGISVGIGAGSTIFTVTFGTAFSAAPHGVISPNNSDATTLGGSSALPYYIAPTTTTVPVSIGLATPGMSSSTVYKWSYVVIG